MKSKLPTTLKQIIALTAAGLFTGSIAIAGNVVVTPGSMDGWTFYSTDSSGVVGTGSAITGMVNGPGTPPLGTGSAQLTTGPGAGNGSAQLRNSSWAGTKIADLTSLNYSTFALAWNGSQLPYLQLYVDFNGDGLYDDRLVFEPTYSSAGAGNGDPSPQPNVALNTWQNWDFLTGMLYDSNGTFGGPGSNAKTLAAFLALHPTATIVNDNGQGIGGVRLTSGFTGAANTQDTYVDDFTIGTAAGTTTYDFEPNSRSVPDAGATAMLLGFALAGLSAFRRWKIAS